MRRFLSIAIVTLVAAGVFFARGNMQSAQQPAGNKKIIDVKADLWGPVAPGDSAIFMVGNFAAQHNGAVITCDSAVRYSDTRIDFFGNVLINKNTTYIYGDRAEYDGDLNEARVFSSLIKVVDGDATLYTYQFLFNTKTNIGKFDGGGVMLNRDNRLESVRGFYYSDLKELIGVDQVQMRNDEYQLKGDSVVYNIETDNAHFFERTNIWSKDNDYLYADRGEYRKADSLYIVTRNGYVLTEKQEMWSDSIDFFRAQDHVILRNNIQLDDTEHKVLGFGDYGEYWKHPGNALLTRRPSVISYDRTQGDSLFMRADSMFVYTIFPRDSVKNAVTTDTESPTETPTDGKPAVGETPAAQQMTPTTESGAEQAAQPADSLQRKAPADSLAVNAADTVRLTPEQLKAKAKEAAQKAKTAKKAAAAKAKKEKLAQLAAKRKEKNTARLLVEREKEQKQLAAMRLKAESKLRARQAKAIRKGQQIQVDSTVLREIDALIARSMMQQDSILARLADTLQRDTIGADSLDSLSGADTMYRLLKGYRNARIYRSDFQAVCDSMTAISTDSTIHLYIDPVMWNENNQIISDVMDIFTKNQQITHANFVGSPLMISELDTVHYNQVAGKTMTAYFRDNQIVRDDVNGNAQTIYYMQDGEPPAITGMGVIESGELSFYMEEKQVVQITYRNDVVFDVFPMDKIPADQPFFLKGFKWEGKRRPRQADVFDRTIRPSDREARSQLPRPDFPILQRIDDYKKTLIEQRRWHDRNDRVDDQTVEWMRELGYEVGQPRETGPKF